MPGLSARQISTGKGGKPMPVLIGRWRCLVPPCRPDWRRGTLTDANLHYRTYHLEVT